MKKIYVLLFAVLTSLTTFGQDFAATYDFASVTSTSGLTDPTPPPTVTGATLSNFTAVNPVSTNPNSGGRFSFSNQPLGAIPGNNDYASLTGSLDPGTYFEVTITPTGTNTIDLSTITFTSQRSGSGIRTYAVRSSIDSYATNLPASIDPTNADLSVQANNVFFRVFDAGTGAENGSTITLTGGGFTGISSAVTFRFYGWNAELSGGTFSIDNVVITGRVNTLGVKQNTISGLNIYPNPVTNGTFYVETAANAKKSIAIFDVLGKEVAKTTTSGNTVNVNNLNNGVYIVKITEEGKTATKKMVIK